jgi:uncharacterized protein YdiU (UPF0061 family)
MTFSNAFIKTLPGEAETSSHSRSVDAFWSPIKATVVSNPQLLASSAEVCAMLDVDPQALQHAPWLNALAGNDLLPGMISYATNYGGHQFGHWAGQLGDGRAIFLGEITNARHESFELQLKGAGPTPYSRRSDGRAVLRSSIREFLCSEAMHHLGIPTTRALSLVRTGDAVMRDMFYDGHAAAEPGAIVCRVAPSFIRFGHFELWAARGDLPKLQQLTDFTMTQYFAEHHNIGSFFREVCARTALLICQWMRVGFVHGVMNTDNMSILGLTLDYGPYGWLDDFDPLWTPNTTDATGRRYCFARQPEIARWNLQQLGNALAPLATNPEFIAQGLEHYDALYQQHSQRFFAAKFGLLNYRTEDAALINDAFDLLQQAQVDMTEFFKHLENVDLAQPDAACLQPAFYDPSLYQSHHPAFTAWLKRYAARIQADDPQQRRTLMRQTNPRFILRNYLAQQAIDQATQGDLNFLHQLQQRLRHPYTDQPEDSHLYGKRPEWAKNKAGCSMLSCSS